MSKLKIIAAVMALSICVFSFASCGTKIQDKTANENESSQSSVDSENSESQSVDSESNSEENGDTKQVVESNGDVKIEINGSSSSADSDEKSKNTTSKKITTSKNTKASSKTTTAKSAKSAGTTSKAKNGIAFHDETIKTDSNGKVVTSKGQTTSPNEDDGWGELF
ncbi:MAG: hypothetical protein ACI4RC_04695 [Oscillospiraceae bacterium]